MAVTRRIRLELVDETGSIARPPWQLLGDGSIDDTVAAGLMLAAAVSAVSTADVVRMRVRLDYALLPSGEVPAFGVTGRCYLHIVWTNPDYMATIPMMITPGQRQILVESGQLRWLDTTVNSATWAAIGALADALGALAGLPAGPPAGVWIGDWT